MSAKPKKNSRRQPPVPAPPAQLALFRARLLGYLVGLVPLLALLLLFRQVLPSRVALGIVLIGFMASVWVQQRVRQRFPHDFRQRAEWWALGAYALMVVLLTWLLLQLVPVPQP